MQFRTRETIYSNLCCDNDVARKKTKAYSTAIYFK